MEVLPVPATVLVVDDVDDERDLAARVLRQGGLTVVEASTALEAEEAVTAHDVALVVLDVGLPNRSGLQLLAQLREHSSLPVILLSGRSGELDRVIGLEFGADDYVVKPFSPRELVARVMAVLRRSGVGPIPVATLRVGRLLVDRHRRTATVGADRIELTRREFDLLVQLAASPGRVVTREDLLDAVWGAEGGGSEASLTEHVRRLRLALDPASVRIRTLRGVGYALEMAA